MESHCPLVATEASFYRPQTKWQKGNVFTPVCQSFCSHGGCLPQCMLGYTPPPGQTPLIRHPPGRHLTPADGYCNGRYASYLNAFLFFLSSFCVMCGHTPPSPRVVCSCNFVYSYNFFRLLMGNATWTHKMTK